MVETFDSTTCHPRSVRRIVVCLQIEKGKAMQLVKQSVITIGQLEIRYLMDSTANGAASGIFEMIVPLGARVPPAHSHSDNEEIIYCLEGTLRTTVADEVRDLAPGDGRYTPRGEVHSFSNPHDRVARAIVILTPDIGAQFFRDVAEAISAPGKPDPAKLAEVMGHYGLVPAPTLPTGQAS